MSRQEMKSIAMHPDRWGKNRVLLIDKVGFHYSGQVKGAISHK
jgi:hypothetical protein